MHDNTTTTRPRRSGTMSDRVVDNPVYYVAKVVFVYTLVLFDLFLNSSFNSDDYSNVAQNDFWPFLFLVLQTSVQVFIFLTLFLLMCGTYLMRIGLPGHIFSDFKWLGLAQVLYLLISLVLGTLRILRFQESQGSLDPRLLWTMRGYRFIFTLQGLCAAVYYQQVLYSTFKLSEEKYYSKRYWGKLGSAAGGRLSGMGGGSNGGCGLRGTESTQAAVTKGVW